MLQSLEQERFGLEDIALNTQRGGVNSKSKMRVIDLYQQFRQHLFVPCSMIIMIIHVHVCQRNEYIQILCFYVHWYDF